MNVAPGLANIDPFYGDYTALVVRILAMERPATQELLWSTIQTIFDYNPAAFTVVSGVRQEDPMSPLHFLVKVDLWNSYQVLDFHGCWQNGFRCTRVLCTGPKGDAPQEIVTFV
jgi:hypothetical protein